MAETSDYILHCKKDGYVDLTQDQYDRHAGNVWHCPICKEKVEGEPVWKGVNLTAH